MTSNPKQSTAVERNWYRYYAGYAPEFVRQALTVLDLPPAGTVLDPWNGSGTTTSIATNSGFVGIGIDANPALVVVARARLLAVDVVDSLEPLAAELIDRAHRLDQSAGAIRPVEPLHQWMDPASARRIRNLESATRRVLIGAHATDPLNSNSGLSGVSSLAAFYYVAMFEMIRAVLSSFRSSNPTWVRVRRKDEAVADADWLQIEELFTNAVTRLASRIRGDALIRIPRRARVLQGDSQKLPLRRNTVDGVLTSPPYCTRIDYVIATLPELAILGYDRVSLRSLRDVMIGTPTIHHFGNLAALSASGITGRTVRSVESHPSRASKSYYLPYLTQYIASMLRSVGELHRVAKPGAKMTLVVQDSHYKEVHLPIPAIVTELAQNQGWVEFDRRDFPMAATRAAINPGTRSYRSTYEATEAVLTFQKPD